MAMAKKLTWIEASRVLGYTDRHMRRVKAKYEREGFMGCTTGGVKWNNFSEPRIDKVLAQLHRIRYCPRTVPFSSS